MPEDVKPSISAAAHALWRLYLENQTGFHPYVQSIGVGDGTIHVHLAREPMRHERQIPASWEGWPVHARVTGRAYLY